MKRFLWLTVLLMLGTACTAKYDVVVIGGGTGGTAAAIEAARNGVSVLIIEQSPWLGGMLTSAGVSAVDGNYRLRGGIFAEFSDSLAARYGGYEALKSGWVSNILFNPAVGADILLKMARETGVQLRLQTDFHSVRHSGKDWIIVLDDGSKVRARILVDGTELGDVASTLDIPALPSDGPVQDLTYVLTVKKYDHDVLIPRPEDYDVNRYRNCCLNPLAENREGLNPDGQHLWPPEQMLSYGMLPDGEMMINWPISGNDYYLDYLNLSKEEREKALQGARNRSLGFLYFMQQELGYTRLGIADDVYPSDDGLPFYPYYREARRIAGRDTMTFAAAAHPYDYDLYTRAVAVGDYPVDHHHLQYPKWKEMHVQPYDRIPSFSVPLGVVMPVSVEDFLVADKAISVDYDINGSTRLQPVILGIGQAAGALAALAVRGGCHPSEVPVRDVQETLLDHGCYLLPFLDLKPGDEGFRQLQLDGLDGKVRGEGRSVGWVNETWVHSPIVETP